MTNVRRTAYGWQLYTRVRGAFVSEHRLDEPTAMEVREWVRLQHAAIKHDLDVPGGATLAEDIAEYLRQVRSMPTYRWRKDDLDRWVTALGGDRPRAAITSAMIRRQLEGWRAEGYAASTVNHRRTALMALWTVLDGKTAPNPARDVPRYRPEDRGPRFMPPATLDTILAHMQPSKTKARLLVLRWTGWPHKTLMRLKPTDLRWNQAVYVTARRKGGGVRGTWMPLVPPAWRALRDFARQRCWGDFSPSSMRQRWREAIARVLADPKVPKAVKTTILPDATPYDQRHSWLTFLALETKDDTAVKEAGQHSDRRQTDHYMEAAGDPRLRAAIDLVARKLQQRRRSRKIRRKTA